MRSRNPRPTRRDFLRISAAGGAASTLAFAAPRLVAADKRAEKLGVAVVGAGGMGGYSVDCAATENFVALVDVDDNTIASIMKDLQGRGIRPKVYHDYRKMLDECHKQLDAVLIATPDHNHAPAAIRAIDLGKATFCQKPLGHNIYECYTLAKAAKRKNVPTQMGNQGHCGETIRRVVECLWAGAVGNVLETHTILGRNFGGAAGRPPAKPVPKGLHWDEWLGPSPYRDYHDNLHPFNWRTWRAFGTGTIGDMACHHLDAPFWALKINEAKHFTVECLGKTGGSEEMFSQDNVVRYDIPARADMPAAKVYVYDHGGLKPSVMKEAEKIAGRTFGEFTLFVGDKGMIGSDARIIPMSKGGLFTPPPKTLPRAKGRGPVEELFYVRRNGGTCCSNFTDSAGPLTSFALAGHLAQFAGVGRKVEWDVEGMRCVNIPEVNTLLRREYRKGWEV